MASIDLGRLVTESLTRFGAGAESAGSDGIDLADVFEAAADKVKPGGKRDKFGTGFVAGKATALEKGEQSVRRGAAATKDAAMKTGSAIKSGASKVYNGSISGAVDSAKSGLGKAGSHIAANKGKYAAGGLALAGMGALAYRYLKNKKKKQAQAAQ